MPARKQLQSNLKVTAELSRLLTEARTRDISDAELKAQRVSFAFGNAPADSKITKDSMREASQRMRLKR